MPTLKGKAKLKIEEGTQPGKLLRMRGKGIVGLNNSGTGDQLLRVNVYMPSELTDEQRKAMESFRESENFDAVNMKQQEKGFFSKMKDVFG